MDNKQNKILFISGAGRSGSTLLERMLGQLDGFVAVGELRHIWSRSYIENNLCSCGLPFSDCPFWREVTEKAFGSGNIQPKKIESLRRNVDRIRYIPLMKMPRKIHSYKEAYNTYSSLLTSLYNSIFSVSGQKIIVDASKDPSTAYLLSSMWPRLYILHLVRDSRAVAYSWQRKKIRPEILNTKTYMRTHSPVKSSWDWNYRNFLIHMLKISRRDLPYLRIHYEKLVQHPKETLRSIMHFLSEEEQEINFIEKGKIFLTVDHTVSGNPFRFKSGLIPLVVDKEWQNNSSSIQELVVSGLTWPLLFAYKYL
jgi:hypothetical protein